MTELFHLLGGGTQNTGSWENTGDCWTSGSGIITNKGLWSNFMLPTGLTSKPHKVAHALIPPGD